MQKSVQRHHVGWPRKFVATLQREIKQEKGEEKCANNQDESEFLNIKNQKENIWVKSNVVHYLWTTYQNPKIASPYEKLTRSNLRIWFTPKEKT